jgi:hypothetical protein
MNKLKPNLLNAALTTDLKLLSRLPTGFENALFALQMETSSRQPVCNRGRGLEALAVMIASGCRAAELELGIHFGMAKDNTLQVFIPELHSEKKSTETVDFRVIRLVDKDRNEATRFLFDLAARTNRSRGITFTANRMGKLVNALSKRYISSLGKKGNGLCITPQTFRLLFARQMSYSDLFTVDDIQQVCGVYEKRSLKTLITEISHQSPSMKWVFACGYRQVKREAVGL